MKYCCVNTYMKIFQHYKFREGWNALYRTALCLLHSEGKNKTFIYKEEQLLCGAHVLLHTCDTRLTFALWWILAAVSENIDLVDGSIRLKQLTKLLLRPGTRNLSHKHLDGINIWLVRVVQRPIHLLPSKNHTAAHQMEARYKLVHLLHLQLQPKHAWKVKTLIVCVIVKVFSLFIPFLIFLIFIINLHFTFKLKHTKIRVNLVLATAFLTFFDTGQLCHVIWYFDTLLQHVLLAPAQEHLI